MSDEQSRRAHPLQRDRRAGDRVTRPEAPPGTAASFEALSHIGASPQRTLLEDRSRVGLIRTAKGLPVILSVVSDGIGGENAGERAAELTVTTIFDHVARSTDEDLPAIVEAALKEANSRVLKEARASRRKTNMGATAAVAAVVRNRLFVASVGDSRVYLVRDGKARPLTVDHTWENDAVRSGKLSRQEAHRHPRRQEIVRFVGQDGPLQVDLGLWLRGGDETEADARRAQGLQLQPGDRVITCSDGLIKSRHDRPAAHYVEEPELAQLAVSAHPKHAAERMVRQALARKVDDNVSVVVVEVPGGPEPPRPFPTRLVAGAAGIILALAASAFLVSSALKNSQTTGFPVLPDLPAGVAYVAALQGSAQVDTGDGTFQPLAPKQILPVGGGLRVRTVGADSAVQFGLSDGSIIVLGPDSVLAILAIGEEDGTGESIVSLDSGTAVGATQPGSSSTLVLTSPTSTLVTLSGTVAGFVFQPNSGLFLVDCFNGLCLVAPRDFETNGVQLAEAQRAWTDGTGTIRGPESSQNQLYAFASFAFGLVPTPTPTPTPTATRTPTPTRRPASPTPKPPPDEPPEPEPPTDTPVPDDTDTPAPPDTDTPEPSNTPKKKSPTPEPPTDTPVPTETPS